MVQVSEEGSLTGGDPEGGQKKRVSGNPFGRQSTRPS